MPTGIYERTEKHRRIISITQIKRFEDPDERERMSIIQKSRLKDPEERKKISLYIEEKWNDEEYRKKFSGPNCPFYIDGRASKDPNRRTLSLEHEKWAKQIRGRDNFTCQLCGKKVFIAHHIDYDPDNFDEDNGICLCRSCHAKTNFDRDVWREFFQILINVLTEEEVL